MEDTIRILRRRIPSGGFGRQLTRSEREALKRQGYTVPHGCIVVQTCGVDWVGLVYCRAALGGYNRINGFRVAVP